ncbi:Transposase, Mutator family [Pseudorhodobacter antarcticus]|jgi:transposase-like protein|uniref:Mutator family transposase n=1 Tax=Pseudorhodobacter antarcticus TaxID=1077947 RepID=A0A1H8MJ76_9RHOB|nr:Transposase, Mutator family [Pseudorhodobacter antarcticus]
MLVIIGADEWGNKDVLGLVDSFCESTQSWRELLLNLKHRGLEAAPKLAVGDGAMGFWAALHMLYGKARLHALPGDRWPKPRLQPTLPSISSSRLTV